MPRGVLCPNDVLRHFLPLDIADCEIWLDFGDADQLTVSSGNVQRCGDKSGNGRGVNQSNPSLRPAQATANGRTYAHFDDGEELDADGTGEGGADNAWKGEELTLATDRHCFILGRIITASGASQDQLGSIGSVASAGDSWTPAVNSAGEIRTSTASSNIVGSTDLQGTGWHVLEWRFNASVVDDIDMFVDGVEDTPYTSTNGTTAITTDVTTNNFTLGRFAHLAAGTGSADYDIDSLVWFSNDLSAADAYKVRAYLGALRSVSVV